MTDDGQETTPTELRDRFGLGAGSEVELVEVEGQLVGRVVEMLVDRVTGSRPGSDGRGVPITTDELMAPTRGH